MKIITKLACAVAPAGLFGAPALAEDTAGTIVVTAVTTTPLTQAPSLGKTGTALADLPRSIQIVPRELIDQQGGVLLKDALRNVSGLAEGGTYALTDFPLGRSAPVAEATPVDDLNLDRVERQAIEQALKKHAFNISTAATELGLSRGTLYRRMEKHGL